MMSMDAVSGVWGILSETRKRLKDSDRSLKPMSEQKINWAQNILERLNVDLEIIGQPTNQKSTLFVGNHISYLDIPLVMASVEDASFVAKEELAQWPLFGSGAQKLGTVFVKRDNTHSRQSARDAIRLALKNGKRVVLFPSGTTSIDENKPWRKGAFEIAHETQTLVQPFRISYYPLREVAFIDQDFFLPHLFKLFENKTIKASIEFHEPHLVKDPVADCQFWNQWSQAQKIITV